MKNIYEVVFQVVTDEDGLISMTQKSIREIIPPQEDDNDEEEEEV